MDNITRDLLSSLSPFSSLAIVPLLLVSLETEQKYSPNTKCLPPFVEYDYIVVGAGSGGAAIASRLSEEPCVTVLLLEAGGKPNILTEVPSISQVLIGSRYDWKYRTVPQKNTGGGYVNREIKYPRGKMFGGTSSLNALIYVRGHREDYNRWAANGAIGWSYEDVLPYFKKSENNTCHTNDEVFHGVNGPQTVGRPPYEAEFKKPIFEAFKEIGYDDNDVNGYNQTGVFDLEATIRHGQRCSTAKAYLADVDHRENFDIVGDAHVTKIVIENNRAVGVQFKKSIIRCSVRAKKEVILSAGVFNTPQLLMLSGIGPADVLQELNIPVIADLPVGQNLQDHVGAVMSYVQRGDIQPIVQKLTDFNNVNEYYLNRTGPLASAAALTMVSFVNSLNSTRSPVDIPEFQLYVAEAQSQGIQSVYGFSEEVYNEVYRPYEGKTIALCEATVQQPRSRGFVTINSTDPFKPPIIDPKYLDDSKDLDDLVKAMEVCDWLFRSEPLQKIGYKPFDKVFPGCKNRTDFKCVAKLIAGTSHHQVGTCKMGDSKDKTTVVDNELKVKGIEGLRVVDASVMPTIIAGNPSNPIIMIAEKAADMIKKTIECEKCETTRRKRGNIIDKLLNKICPFELDLEETIVSLPGYNTVLSPAL